MAPLPVITNICRVAFQWTNAAYPRHSVNVMHFQCVPTDIDDLMAKLEANVTALMWQSTLQSSSITSINFTPLDGTSGSIVKTPSGGTKWQGSGSTGETIPQVATILKLTTGLRGRSHRGRVYLPWTAESVAVNGALVNSVLVSMQGAWSTFRNAMDTATHPLQVASYLHSTSSAVQAIQVESQLATQRRRQPRP